MRARIGKAQSLLRYSFWFIPALMSLGGAGLSLALTEIGIPWSARPVPWVGALGTAGIRDFLAMIASSMIAVATTAFSIIIVALQLASGQIGPRLLRNFVRDRTNQFVFGTFLGIFVYNVLLLRRIAAAPRNTGSIEHAVLLALVFALAAVVVLIVFIHHAALSIQKDRVIARVSTELSRSIDKLYPKTIGREPPEIHTDTGAPAQRLPERATATWSDSTPLRLQHSGYIQAVDAKLLMRVAVQNDIQIYLTKRPGDFSSFEATVALVRPRERMTARVQRRLQDVFVLGIERTAQQDVAFVFDQLVEVGIRALSPGITDSFTAIRCIDHIVDNLSRVARTPIPSPYRFDDRGDLRVITEPLNFAVLVDQVLYPVAEAAARHTAVVSRLFRAVAEIADSCAAIPQRQSLGRFNDYLAELSRAAPARAAEYAGHHDLFERARRAVTP